MIFSSKPECVAYARALAWRIIRYNPLTRAIVKLVRAKSKQNYRHELCLYRSLLGENCDLIFDIGANRGDKSEVFLGLANQVVAIEPDPINILTLKIRFPFEKRLRTLESGVGEKLGEAKMFVTQDGSALNTMSVKWKHVLQDASQVRWGQSYQFVRERTVKMVTLDWLISRFGKPDFVKVDVEGYEWPVVCSLTSAVPLISIECNLPEFKEETLKCIEHLASLNENARFNAHNGSRWLLDDFVEKTELENWLIADQRQRFFELFCKNLRGYH